MLNNIKILNIPFTTLFEKEILELLQKNCRENQKTFIATPNPEMLLACLNNSNFQNILQNTSLNIPDGNGLIWANLYLNSVKNYQSKTLIVIKGILSIFAFLFYQKNEDKTFNKAIHGSDLMQEICFDSELSQYKIFFLGNKNGLKSNVAKLASEKIQSISPKTNIVAYYDSIPTDQEILVKINDAQTEIVFVAFGAPAQETWIAENLLKMPSVKIIMGVGGSFDFIAGVIPRAPFFMRKIGLEWVYRLFKQPFKRIKRIYNAFIVFPSLIIKNKLAEIDQKNLPK